VAFQEKQVAEEETQGLGSEHCHVSPLSSVMARKGGARSKAAEDCTGVKLHHPQRVDFCNISGNAAGFGPTSIGDSVSLNGCYLLPHSIAHECNSVNEVTSAKSNAAQPDRDRMSLLLLNSAR